MLSWQLSNPDGVIVYKVLFAKIGLSLLSHGVAGYYGETFEVVGRRGSVKKVKWEYLVLPSFRICHHLSRMCVSLPSLLSNP